MEEQLNLFDFQVENVRVEPKYRLTPRQWALYRLIKENTEAGRKTTQREICEKVEGYEWHTKESGSHDHCPQIWEDINGEKGINWAAQVQKTIISQDFEYWLGNDEEIDDYIGKMWFSGIYPRLRRYWALVGKRKSHGQGQIFSCEGNLIDDESKARGYIDAFMEHPKFNS